MLDGMGVPYSTTRVSCRSYYHVATRGCILNTFDPFIVPIIGALAGQIITPPIQELRSDSGISEQDLRINSLLSSPVRLCLGERTR